MQQASLRDWTGSRCAGRAALRPQHVVSVLLPVTTGSLVGMNDLHPPLCFCASVFPSLSMHIRTWQSCVL